MRTTTAALVCCLVIAALVVPVAGTAGGTAGQPAVATTGDHQAAPFGSHAADTRAAPSTDATPVSLPPAASAGTPTATPTILQSGDRDGQRPEVVDIRVQSDGDARFHIRKEFDLGGETQAERERRRETFEDLARRFENGQYELAWPTFEVIVQDVDQQVDRNMTLEELRRESTMEGDVGTIERRFTWRNFANETDGRLEVGDAFYDQDGQWLTTLESHQTLVIQGPDGYRPVQTPSGPSVNDNRLTWTGPTTLEEGELQVVFERGAAGPDQLVTILVGGLGLLIAVLAGYLLWRDTRTDDAPASDPLTALARRVPASGGDTASGNPPSSSANTESADGGTPVQDVEPTEPEPAEDEPDDDVDPELLSDGERVEYLLEQNGGRMKQATIVTETDWSNAKVSQLLSEMDEDDRIDKLRIGRENLITLPDEDVAEFDE